MPPSDTAAPDERSRLDRLLSGPTVEAARGLVGAVLVRRLPARPPLSVRIVETEAYLGPQDPAAHSYAGRTPRTDPLWGPPGTVYVYLVYGMHHCLNVAVDRSGFPGCVLIRAAEPLPGSGLDALACSGPGRLCRALAIDAALSGRHLFEQGAALSLREGRPAEHLVVAPRVGITRAAELPLRFCDAASAAVSAPRPAGVSFGHIPRRGQRRAAAHARRQRR